MIVTGIGVCGMLTCGHVRWETTLTCGLERRACTWLTSRIVRPGEPSVPKLLPAVLEDKMQLLVPLHLGTQISLITVAILTTHLCLERWQVPMERCFEAVKNEVVVPIEARIVKQDLRLAPGADVIPGEPVNENDHVLGLKNLVPQVQ